MSLPPYPCLGIPVDGACPQTPTYPARECTSGASWWASQYTGKPWPEGWGNALNWPTRARDAGFDVDTEWSPNSIMCLGPWRNGAGAQGHVAYVVGAAVASQHVEVWEMNFLIEHGFDFRPALITGCEYIHLVGKPVPPPSTSGDPFMVLYQRKNGSTYMLCGGSLMPLGSVADITYALSKGAQLYLEADMTVAWASGWNALPVIA